MEISAIVAPGPPGIKVVPEMATADEEGAAVKVRLPTVKVLELGA